MSVYEYCVMYPRISTTKLHRGPYSTWDQAAKWIVEAEEDGFKQGTFKVYRRATSPWEEAVDQPS